MNNKYESALLNEINAILADIFNLLVGIALLTCLLGLLFAPLLEPLLTEKLISIGVGDNGATKEEMLAARKAVVSIRSTLWIVAIVSWIIFGCITIGYQWH
jgi:hypothetical protein